MTASRYITEKTKHILQLDPPGAWMPNVPAGCIRLSSGYPDALHMPVHGLKEAADHLLQEEGALPLHYLGTPSIEVLHKWLLERMKERGMAVTRNELLITSGASQAIEFTARILLDEQTIILVEEAAYMEALEIFRNYTPHLLPLKMDDHGLDTNALEALLQQKYEAGEAMPRVLYTNPTCQNPTGTTLSAERRAHLLRLAARFDFIIIEDDAYGELSFHDVTPLYAMPSEAEVIYIGSLSKTVAPGMRIGWIAASEAIIHACTWFKKDLDHPFSQSVMAKYVESTDWPVRMSSLKERYKGKCRAMDAALTEHMPESVRWVTPEGGFFVWLVLPEQSVDTTALLDEAMQAGVSYIPGQYFCAKAGAGHNALRLSFSEASEEQIRHGVKILADVLKRNGM